jgi:hypothetical protein
MSKLALFLAGMLLGLFMSLYHIRSQQIREYDVGPQTEHPAANNHEEWTPCEDMANANSYAPLRGFLRSKQP